MSLIYNYAKSDFVTGRLDWDDSSYWKVMLVGPTYTPDPDHQYASSIEGHELDGVGYASGYGNSGRKDLIGRTVATNLSTDKAYMTANDISWTNINAGIASAAVIIVETGGSDSTSKVVVYLDGTGFPITTNGGDLTVAWTASGIINVV